MEIFTFVYVCHVLMFNFSMVNVEHCRYMILSSFQWGCVGVKPNCHHDKKASCYEIKRYCSFYQRLIQNHCKFG